MAIFKENGKVPALILIYWIEFQSVLYRLHCAYIHHNKDTRLKGFHDKLLLPVNRWRDLLPCDVQTRPRSLQGHVRAIADQRAVCNSSRFRGLQDAAGEPGDRRATATVGFVPSASRDPWDRYRSSVRAPPQLGGFFLALFNADVFKVKVHTLHLFSVCCFSFWNSSAAALSIQLSLKYH